MLPHSSKTSFKLFTSCCRIGFPSLSSHLGSHQILTNPKVLYVYNDVLSNRKYNYKIVADDEVTPVLAGYNYSINLAKFPWLVILCITRSSYHFKQLVHFVEQFASHTSSILRSPSRVPCIICTFCINSHIP